MFTCVYTVVIVDFPAGGRDHPSVHHSSGGPTPRQFLPDETDLQATRSLFVGNIPKNISIFELRDAFQRYGNVLVSCMYICCVISDTCTGTS